MDESVNQHCARWSELRSQASKYATSFPGKMSWSIVFQFYAALHLMQAHLLSKGAARFEVTNHHERKKAIDGSPELRSCRAAYRDLKNLSEDTRYGASFVPTADNYKLAAQWLGQVEAIVRPKLERKGAAIPTE